MNNPIPLPKLKAIIRYLCTYTNPLFLGKVKLMKLIYFIDFTNLKKYGVPITYDNYYNLELGPIPSVIKNLVDEVDTNFDEAELADTIAIVKKSGSKIHRVVCHRKFSRNDRKYFSENELKVLKEVCSRFKDKNTKYLVEQSHKEAPWQKTHFRDEISYTLAAEDPDSLVNKEEIELLNKLV